LESRLRRALSVAILAILATAGPARADLDELLESFEVYGSLRGHVAATSIGGNATLESKVG
jgi:hypothetical protein